VPAGGGGVLILTWTNTGNCPLTFVPIPGTGGVLISVNGPPLFGYNFTDCGGLGPGESCPLEIDFGAGSFTGAVSATITISDNGSQPSVAISAFVQ